MRRGRESLGVVLVLWSMIHSTSNLDGGGERQKERQRQKKRERTETEKARVRERDTERAVDSSGNR